MNPRASSVSKSPRAFVYVRLSDVGPGGRETAGLDRQEADCRAFAKQHGFDVTAVFRDEGVSATRGDKRQAFKEMLGLLDIGQAEVVLVWRLDRLTRRSIELERLLEITEREKITLYTVQDGHRSSPGSNAMLRIAATLAGEESRILSVRVTRAKLERARAGEHTGGGARPYGWTDGTKKREKPSEKKMFLELVDRVIAGETCHAIAQDWNSRNIPSTVSGRWSSTQLYNLVRSPRYVGKVLYQRTSKTPQLFPAKWKPFISEAKWIELQMELERRDKEPKNGGFHGRKHLLSGFLVCGNCGYKLLAWKGSEKKPPVYLCQKRTEHPNRCGRSRILMTDADETAMELVLRAMRTPAFYKSVAAGASSRVYAEKQKRLKAVDARIRDLNVKLYKGEIRDGLALGQAMQELEDERHSLEAELAGTKVTSTLKGRTLKSASDWAKLSLLEQRQVIAGLFDYIVIKRGGMRQRAVTRMEPIFVMQPTKPGRVAGRLMLESVIAAQKPRRGRGRAAQKA